MVPRPLGQHAVDDREGLVEVLAPAHLLGERQPGVDRVGPVTDAGDQGIERRPEREEPLHGSHMPGGIA